MVSKLNSIDRKYKSMQESNMKHEIKLKDSEKYQTQFSTVQNENVSLKRKFDELHQDFQNLNISYRNEVNMRKE